MPFLWKTKIPIKVRNKADVPSQQFFNILLEDPGNAIRRKEIISEMKKKKSIFIDDLLVYVENPKESMKKRKTWS